MEFRVALFFLFLYYIRPQDWVQALIGFNIIKPLMVLWTGAILMSRDRPPPRGVLRTPHDWVMLFYFIYVVWNAPDSQGTFNAFMPLVVFYLLTVLSLNTWDRVLVYLKAWNWMLVGVSFMAVASLYGFDLTDAAKVTTKNAGRLSIGTWLHNNPNSLAHSVVAVLPLSYLLYFWKGSALGRFVIFPLCVGLAGLCAYHTQSKGSYLVAGGLLVMIFVIGRPWPVKLLSLAAAATLGVSALSFLPRMQQMSSLRADEGVQGRLLAWEMARNIVDKAPTGEGWRQFVAMITWEGETFPKATHSSYVQIGADLGLYGIFLYIAGIWCAVHTLLSAHRLTRDRINEERSRRCALIILIAYAVSSWMINREYHTEYFLMIAVAAAIHRLCREQTEAATATVDEPDSKVEQDDAAPAMPVVQLSARTHGGRIIPRLIVENQDEEETVQRPFWNRLGIVDCCVSAGLTWMVLVVWDHVLESL